MTLAQRISELAARIGDEIRGLVRPEHPGLARAWASFGYVSGAIQVHASHNVASVTRLAAGRYRVQFATPFADAGYCWVATARADTATLNIRYAAARASTDLKTTDALELVCTSSTGQLADTTEVNLVVFR